MAAVLSQGVNNAFQHTSDGVRGNISEVQRSGDYYVTHELNREMDRINNGVNHMKLDSEFINTSKEWGTRFDREALNQEKANSAAAMGRGAQVVGQYKTNFRVPQVSNMQENQIREAHQWAARNLDGAKQDLHPFAKSAQGRINQFCDSMGVTDRFTGYRHNLTRGSRDPTKLGMSWLNDAQPNQYQANMTSGSRQGQGVTYLPASLPKRRVADRGACDTINPLHPRHSNTMSAPAAPRTKSIQERCGINTTFPGITEYMKRYNQKHQPGALSAFNINPTPDLSIYGRPSASIEYTPNHTEYQTRYEFPECSKIVKKPWLRK